MSYSGAGKRERFDSQAESFDARAGLPAGAGEAVASAVLHLCKSNPDHLLIEIGAGTGEIGQYLAHSVEYVAIDKSAKMLAVFRRKLAATGSFSVKLINADADKPWPVDDGSATAVFASRSAHLLDSAHLLAELLRVCKPGGHFLVGRVVRDKDGLKSRMRRERSRMLAGQGTQAVGGDELVARVLDGLVALGAVRVEPRAVTGWTASGSGKEILEGWRDVEVSGGANRGGADRSAVLMELEKWAARELGDLERVDTWTERYVLEGVKLSTSTG